GDHPRVGRGVPPWSRSQITAPQRRTRGSTSPSRRRGLPVLQKRSLLRADSNRNFCGNSVIRQRPGGSGRESSRSVAFTHLISPRLHAEHVPPLGVVLYR